MHSNTAMRSYGKATSVWEINVSICNILSRINHGCYETLERWDIVFCYFFSGRIFHLCCMCFDPSSPLANFSLCTQWRCLSIAKSGALRTGYELLLYLLLLGNTSPVIGQKGNDICREQLPLLLLQDCRALQCTCSGIPTPFSRNHSQWKPVAPG